MFKKFKKYIKILLIIFLLIKFFFLFINFYIIYFWKNRIVEMSNLENHKIWLVLWASVKSSWEPSGILADRLQSSYEAYKLWKIQKIIVSWDNWNMNYNEPDNMKRYLISLWVNSEDIQSDYAGFDTYDSMYRAKNIFWVDKMVIFTQRYHLYRALYIANRLWIESVWIASDKKQYSWLHSFQIREVFSRVKAFFEVEILKSSSKIWWEKIEIK